MMITEHFAWKEFESRGNPVPNDLRPNVIHLCHQLEVLRAHIGAPIHITSGWRSEHHNQSVSGAKRSQHLTGRAADIRVKGMRDYDLHAAIEELVMAGKMEDGGLGIYARNQPVHYDVRGSHARWDWR